MFYGNFCVHNYESLEHSLSNSIFVSAVGWFEMDKMLNCKKTCILNRYMRFIKLGYIGLSEISMDYKNSV